MIAMLDTLKEENNKSKKKKKKKREKRNLTSKKGSLETTNNNHYVDGHQHQWLAILFFHPSWRKGSHASKEDK
jgi:hypothetical protein